MPGQGSRAEGTYETYEFTVGPNDANGAMNVKVEWDVPANDFDLYLVLEGPARRQPDAGRDSADAPPETDEQLTVPNPAPGTYVVWVDNFAAVDPMWRGIGDVHGACAGRRAPSGTATGAFSPAEKTDVVREAARRGCRAAATWC